MCTLSWYYDCAGYHVFFNRDEQITRESAQLPKIIQGDKCSAIMPIDPQGQGTWLASNQFGVSIALLNFYQGMLKENFNYRSRGEIVKKLSNCTSYADFLMQLSVLPLAYYPPFSLICFDSKNKDNHNKNPISVFQWNGEELQEIQQLSPMVSSSVDFENVESQRRQQFLEQHMLNDERCGVQIHRDLHAQHLPTKSAYSICMHREDACTVSFSHIQVTNVKVIYEYTNGSPCESNDVTCVSMQMLDSEYEVKNQNQLDNVKILTNVG